MIKKLRITVEGKAYDVTVEVLGEQRTTEDSGSGVAPVGAPLVRGPNPSSTAGALSSAASARSSGIAPKSSGAGAVVSPMAGAVKEVLVRPGDAIEAGQAVVILDAMKMENKISAPAAGTITSVAVQPGDNVQEGQLLVVVGTS